MQRKSFPVLFVVTGYGSPDSTISMDRLLKKISVDTAGTFILAEIKSSLDSILNISSKAVSVESWDEVPASDSVLFITDIDHLLPEMRVLCIDNIDFFDDPGNYPLSISKETAKQKRDSITFMIISGVTAITRAEGTAADVSGIDFLTKNLKPYFEKADYVHISNEVSFCKNCQYTAGMQFCTKEEHFKALLDLHCNIVELTGNHNRDYGDAAFRETYKWYKDHNIKTFGGGDNPKEANTPLVITLKDSTKIGFIGFNELCPNGECADVAGECGANRYDSSKAATVIEKMKDELKCNFIIASVQFSEWDYNFPHEPQKKICNDLLKMGADMVYGSQAHQAQQITFINHKPVFYGLGNLLFDQIHRISVRQAFFLQLYFYKGKLIQSRPVLTFMQLNRQQHIASAEEAIEIRKAIFNNSILYQKK
jgi:poly-gamma-glutamate capsule biosynthesis protein CapA/YwtB (metallophosphatase superfamily)